MTRGSEARRAKWDSRNRSTPSLTLAEQPVEEVIRRASGSESRTEYVFNGRRIAIQR
jgi:hypothetical protein